MQKGSPYLDEMNRLLGLAHQIGLLREFDNFFQTSLPNVTKCSTWQDIQASHMAAAEKAVIKLEDTYGIMSLYAIGMSGGLVIFLMEVFVQGVVKKNRKRAKKQLPVEGHVWSVKDTISP